MQNFTLGKRGISMLFFAFFLLIGSSPTFGQTNCPTPGEATTPPEQTFCYLATVGDIQRDGTNTAVYQTADNANDTQPIPSTELLSDNTTYYVGEQSGTCTRLPVTVGITAENYPNNILFPGQNSFTISPCFSTFTAEDLAAYFTAISGYEIRVYDTEFGTTEASGPLTPDASYFVGQVSTAPASAPDNCPSPRVAVGYNPQPTPPPTATSPQIFCEGATVGDLQAQGTSPNTQAIRWYRTATSFEPLANSTLLIDGANYYATQVINDRNSPLPPCESETRTPVTVEIQEPVDLGTPAAGIICESDVDATFPSIDEIRKYYLVLLPEGTPTNGTFNPTPAQLAQIYQNDEDGLGDFTTTYTVGVEGCESSVELTATIVAEKGANAGTIENITVDCEDDTIVTLDDSLLSEDATTGGTFSGEGVNEDGNFDPAIGPGTYTITYSVNDSADCVIEGTSDSTTFTITVQGSELGGPIVMEMCITEVPLFDEISDAEAFFRNFLEENGITNFGGTFTPAGIEVVTAIFDYINSDPTEPKTFFTNYTVTTDCGEESVDITLTINNTEEPNAGEITPAPVCSSATPFDLNSLLGDNNDANGTFSYENGEIENGLFDVSQAGEFVITYTVTASDENCTAGDDDATTFTLTVSEGIVAESPEPTIVCETDVQALFPSNDEIRKFYIAIAQKAGFPTNGTLNPNAAQLASMYQNDADGLGDFTTTYTFGDGDCQTSVDLTVTIIPAENANAGSIEDITVDCDSDEVIVLASLPNEEGNTGGTFSGDGVDTEGNFDPSIGPGTYTITYSVDDTADCVIEGTTDETTFTITVQGSFELGDPIVMEMCITEVQSMLTNPQLAIDLFNDAVAERTNGDLSGEFTPSIQTIAGQIAAYLANPTPSQTFETTYSVSTECGDDSVLISLTIKDVTEATTGDIANFQVCAADSTINLFDRLTDANTQGGTFSNEDGEIADGIFNVSQIGEYTITYTVSEDQEGACVEGTASTQFTITVTDGITLENPAPAIICESDVQALFPSNDEIRKFFVALLPAGVPTNGTLNPTPAQIAQMYQNDADGLGDFTTTYSVTIGDCVTSVQLTARVVAEEEATTGTIANLEVCLAEGNINLFDRLTDANTPGGTFSNEDGILENGLLDVSEEGVYTITYTVSEDDAATCLTGTASTEFTVTVSESTFDAGADNSIEVCNADVRNLSETGVRNLYLGLLDEGVSTNGTFEPTISQLITQYNIVSNYGDFTTTYTLGEGDCADSAVLTVTVIEANDAGADVNLTFCASDGPVDLFDYLSAFASTNGTFSGLTNGMFDPSSATIGETVITYEVEDDESVCSTGNFTATFTINVIAAAPANAGGNQTATYCLDENVNVQLTSLLGDDALLTGSFSAPYENGVFNPSTAGVGIYVITYTVDGEDNCAIGSDSATITITVTETPNAPIANAVQSFCLINNPTVANIVATGENVILYLDQELSQPAIGTSPLAHNAVFYAASTANGCQSEAVMITISLTDGTPPTLQTDGNEFCRSDNPTIQDLINNFSGNAIQIFQASNGGSALATSTALVDGVTYFASATDAAGCESSERTPAQVKVAFCGIPEAFSPNGDNINDRFVIPDIAIDFPNYTIEIFNRWGNEVFKGNTSTGDWDGTSNQSGTLGDNVLAAGVYFYILNYNDGQTAPIQGKVYLSR